MADFNQIVQDVYTITNRSDLVAETQLAVKSATLQLHRQDFFFKDLLEVALQFDSSNYLQAIDYRQLFPRYRALKYLRKFDPTAYGSTGVGRFFDVISPEEILDSYYGQLSDVVYVAGDLIQIRSATAIQYALIGIYQSPDVSSPEKYKSWIADESPYAVVYMAAASIFGTILGNQAKQAANSSLAQIEFTHIRNSNIVATGE